MYFYTHSYSFCIGRDSRSSGNCPSLLLNTTCIAQVEIQKDRQINTDTYTICINTNVTCTNRDTKTCSHANKNTKCTYRDTKTEVPTLRCKQSNFVAKNTNKGFVHIVHIGALCNYASVWSTTGISSFVMISIIYNLK